MIEKSPPRLSLCFFAPGQNVHTHRWCTAMAARGHRVTLVPQEAIAVDPLEGVDVLEAFPKGVLRSVPNLRALLFARRARQLMEASKADVYHMHWFNRRWVTRRIFSNRHPLIISVWGSDIITKADEPSWLRQAKRRGLAQADLICATTHYLKEQTLPYCKPDSRIELIPFGVDVNLFRPNGQQVHEPVICFVKHLRTNYGADVLVEAMRAVVSEIPAARLIMAGEGEMEASLRARVEALRLQEHVEFRGRVPHAQVPQLLREAAVMAMPSTSESFGVAAVEAASCCVPTVASRIGGIPEAVVDGRTGILVPPGDAQALAEALIRLLRDHELRWELGQAARAYVAEHYDWQENVRRMEAIYVEMAK